MNQNHYNKNSKRAVYVAVGVLLVIAILAAILLFRGCSAPVGELPDDTSPGLTLDQNAVVGTWEELDTDAIVDALNQQVEAGMIRISMNTSPIFESGTAAGNLMIVNESVNTCPQVIEITRNDTGELIYKSGAIPVGSKIENAPLDVVLPAGTYECTAMFHNVDLETGDSLGCAGAIIHITVLN